MAVVTDWNKYPNFTEQEMSCSHTGKCEIDEAFMDKLQTLRTVYGKPMYVTSGYRDPTHPLEARKSKPGDHAKGVAVDIHVFGQDALDLLRYALEYGFNRIGVNQKGAWGGRFIHLGLGTPAMWSY